MALHEQRDPNKKTRQFAQISLLAAVPAILVAAPLIGFFAGKWLDRVFKTEPYIMIVGICLGFGSAGLEIYSLVKKSERFDEKDDTNKPGN